MSSIIYTNTSSYLRFVLFLATTREKCRSNIRLKAPPRGTLALLLLLAAAARGKGGGQAAGGPRAAGAALATTFRHAIAGRRPSRRATTAYLHRHTPGFVACRPLADGAYSTSSGGDRTSGQTCREGALRHRVNGGHAWVSSFPGGRAQASAGEWQRGLGECGGGSSSLSSSSLPGVTARSFSCKPSTMCQQASAVPQTAEYPSNPSHATHPPQPHAHLIRRELPDASTIAGEWGRREAGQALPAVERGIQNGYADVESIDVAELRREQERRSTGQAVDRTGMDRWDPALLMNARAAAKRVEDARAAAANGAAQPIHIPPHPVASPSPVQVEMEMESAAEDFSGLKVSQLKERLATLGLKVSGKKADLVDRLQQQQQGGSAALANSGGQSHATSSESEASESLSKLTAVQLRNKLRELGLKVSGKKAELVERLQQQGAGAGAVATSANTSEVSAFTAPELGGVSAGQRDGMTTTPSTSSSARGVANDYANEVNGRDSFGGSAVNRLARTPVSDTVSMTGGVAQRQEQQQQESRTDGGEALHTLERGVREGFAVPAVVKPESIADIPLPKTLGDKVEGVQIVAGRENAREVVKILMDNPDVFFGCDTEVAELDLKHHGPIGNGRITCISIYGGPELDCGDGPGKILWVDNMGDSEGTLEEFLPFFASEKHKKVWHNYGFDRHVMFNAPDRREEQRIDCRGFGGDTMHMARLWDTSMEKWAAETGYSLEALSLKLLGEKYRKTPMKELFGVPRLKKDGTPGNMLMLPPIDEIQTRPEMRPEFIKYSAYDAQATWLVHRALQDELRKMEWKTGMTMLDFYEMYYVPFGELLTDMERTGIYVAAEDYLKDIEVQARKDKKKAQDTFMNWVTKMQPSADLLNPSSSTQIQTLLFGGSKNDKTGEILPTQRIFKVSRDQAELDAAMEGQVQDEYVDYTATMLKDKLKEMGLKLTGKKDVLLARIRGEEKPEVGAEFKSMKAVDLQHACQARGLNSDGTKAQLIRKLTEDTVYQLELLDQFRDEKAEVKSTQPKLGKYRDMPISSLGMDPVKFTASGSPAVSIDVLQALAGNPSEDPPRYGTAFHHFGGEREGKEACEALHALCNMGSVDTMVGTFLRPLQELVDEKSRVHCSLNLNTETGRLSARKPNLQNQPALEKDQYKIRAAFRAEKGNSLVVADYGQLELRLLAHITKCKSMIDAFKEGGCFHSRTAVGMYDHVRKAVDDGDVLLEWDYSKGAPPKPLVKDVYASERRKAKTLNFSIAYGKTAHGLSKDWGVSQEEAEGLVKAWYADRPEVQEWQRKVIQNAKATGYSRTLMGRYRKIPAINSDKRSMVGHGTRAAINTPIQGGAADVAMVAMIRLVRSPLLQKWGWKLLLQVHDEVILEGPEETEKEALAEVVECMQQPWDGVGLKELRVDLLVDAKAAKTWYDAK